MKRAVGVFLVGAAVLCMPARASAGLLDKLKEVNEQMEQKNQQMQQQQSSGGGNFGGSLSAGLGATTLDGLTHYNNCMAPLNGHHEKLQAEVLQRKLAASPNLPANKRREMEEDIEWLNKTSAGAIKLPHPNPQRWLLDFTDEEQQEVHVANQKFTRKVHRDCEKKYGGMTGFVDSSGRNLKESDYDPYAGTEEPTVMKKPPSAMDDLMQCMAAGQGLRWQIIADKMQAKLQGLSGLSGQDRKAWEEDIAVVRAAAQAGGTTMPQSPDPKNPMRYMMRLTGEDQMAVNTEYAAASQAHQATCSAPVDKAEADRNRGQGEEIAKRAREQAAANVKGKQVREERNRKADADRVARGGGGSLSASLGATDLRYMQQASACFDPIKGHMAKVTAETLEKKLQAASRLTPQQRQAWSEDITAWRAAEAAGADEAIPPNLDNPYRWQDHLTRAERQQINQQHAAFANKINAECNATDHMNTPTKIR